MAPVSFSLLLAALVFVIGLVGVFINRKNVIIVLLSIELMLLAVSINFVTFAYALGDALGQIFVIFILTAAAAEAAVGLAILIVYFRTHGNIEINSANSMKE